MEKKRIPDHSPLLAPNVACHTCGDIIQAEVVKGFHGKVEHVRYKHFNEETGCSYVVETNAMLIGEMKPLREDGSEIKL